MILKFRQNGQGTRIAKKFLKNKNEIGRITTPQLQYINYKAIVIKTMWYWQTDLDQWNRPRQI